MPEKKSKILFIVQLPPPWHGVSVMNENVINNPLLAKKYDTRVLHMDFGQTLKDLGTINLTKLYYFLLFILRMVRELVFRRPKLVYFTFMPRGINLYRDTAICLFIKLFGSRPLIHLHGRGIREFAEESRLKRILFRMAFRNSQLISLSPILTQDVASVYKAVPLVLANGIKAPACNPIIRNPDAVPVILFFSNLFVAKGIFDFLNMLKILSERGHVFRAVIAGGNGDVTKKAVLAFCTKADFVDHVSILGTISGNNKWTIFQDADVFVLPSHNECFPLTILEAMSAGLPVVATRIGGIPDIIEDGVNGYMIGEKNMEELVNAVEKIITDTRLRKSMSERSLQLFNEKYTIQVFQQKFTEMLDSIV